MIRTSIILLILAVFTGLESCQTKKVAEAETTEYRETNKNSNGPLVQVGFKKGPSHNHPSFVVWVEDLDGKYVETLYITKSVGTGVFLHGKPIKRDWEPSQKRYPASLPYWAHKRGIKAPDGLYVPDSTTKVADAITGATPKANFELRAKMADSSLKEFAVLLEVNQTWDFNEYWTNNKYPNNMAYKTSCQPAVVYAAQINLGNLEPEYLLKPIGHSHFAGENGELFKDLGTITTALEIFVEVRLKVVL